LIKTPPFTAITLTEAYASAEIDAPAYALKVLV